MNTLYLPELREMLALNDTAGLSEFCLAIHPARTAEFMEGLTAEESWRVIQCAPSTERVEIFGFFDEEKQKEIVETLGRAPMAELIEDLPPDDRVDLLADVDQEVVDELMPLLPTDERRDIQRLSAYPEDSAGGEMTTEVAKFPEEMTVGEVLQAISGDDGEFETIFYIYVVDAEDHLRGIISARDLLSHIRSQSTKLEDLMERDVVTVEALDDREEVAKQVARYNLLAIPVVDEDYRLVGIVTHDDVMDVVVEEATEDAQRIAAVKPLDEGYLETGTWLLVWKRGVWLTVLFFWAMLTAVTIGHYESEIEKYAWLVLFIPLIISTGGNIGTQTATLIITALSTGNVTLMDSRRLIMREIFLGFVLGGLLAAIGYLCATIYSPDPIWQTALVIPITLVLIAMTGTLLGSILPLTFRRLGLDPALMSSPFVAGLVDVLGIVIYMTVALSLLP